MATGIAARSLAPNVARIVVSVALLSAVAVVADLIVTDATLRALFLAGTLPLLGSVARLTDHRSFPERARNCRGAQAYGDRASGGAEICASSLEVLRPIRNGRNAVARTGQFPGRSGSVIAQRTSPTNIGLQMMSHCFCVGSSIHHAGVDDRPAGEGLSLARKE